MSLRQQIVSKSHMQGLRDSLRESFSPNKLAVLLSHTINDPAVQAAMSKAIGSKGENKLDVRVADDITATLLGFNNTHEMFAHYNNVTHVRRWEFLHKNKHEDYAPDYLVEVGVHFSVLDAIALEDNDFEHDRIDERFELLAMDEAYPASDEDLATCITSKSDAPAVVLSMSRDGLFDDIKMSDSAMASQAFTLLESMILTTSAGIPFALDSDEVMKRYTLSDMAIFSVSQDVVDSELDLLTVFLEEGVLEGTITVPLPAALLPLAPLSIRDGMHIYTLLDGYTLHFSPASMMFILAHNDAPCFGGGIHLHEDDLRRQAFTGLA